MRRISLLALLLMILSVIPAQGKSRTKSVGAVNSSATEQEVLRDFERILDLWRDGKYDDLFERTATSRESKEQFARKISSAPRKPACCWEKMQEARVSLKSGTAAVVRARLGFEGSIPGTEYVTKGIKMKKEDGVWMISQADLFSLASLSKKRARYKYLPIQPK
jgi:hypothetical protein